MQRAMWLLQARGTSRNCTTRMAMGERILKRSLGRRKRAEWAYARTALISIFRVMAGYSGFRMRIRMAWLTDRRSDFLGLAVANMAGMRFAKDRMAGSI